MAACGQPIIEQHNFSLLLGFKAWIAWYEFFSCFLESVSHFLLRSHRLYSVYVSSRSASAHRSVVCSPFFLPADLHRRRRRLVSGPRPGAKTDNSEVFQSRIFWLTSKCLEGLESSILRVAADTSRWSSPMRSRHCYHYILYRQIHCSSRLTGLEMDRPTLDLSSLDDVIDSCFRNSNQRCIRQE